MAGTVDTLLRWAERVGGRIAPSYAERRSLARLRAQWDSTANLLFAQWVKNKEVLLGGRFTGWNHQLALARDVTVDFDRAAGLPGGEHIDDALEQSEGQELYTYEKGFFQLDGVSEAFRYDLPFHLTQWIGSFTGRDEPGSGDAAQPGGVALGITRYEYANLFHVMTELYNAFLVLRFLDVDRREVTALLMDGHPSSALDELFVGLFGDCRRIGEYEGKHRFERFIFNVAGYQSPLMPHLRQGIPYAVEFRNWMLDAFDISSRTTERVRRITFVWRRDYLAHPRNPTGGVDRQINNESELIEETRKHFRGVDVEGVVLEELSIAEQVRCVATSDILIGMHGAGLTYALLLPDNAALIELYPHYYSAGNRHFVKMAHARGLHYRRWQNRDRGLELDRKSTHIPFRAVRKAIHATIKRVERP